MGGDRAPGPEVAGAVAAVRSAPVEVILVGDEPRLRTELARLGADREPRLSIRHATQVVTMDDHPSQAFRKKRDSSLRVAFDLVAAGDAAAVVSAGNSGAVLGHALFVLKRLPGVERPGIVTVFPTPDGTLVLCDMGANVDVRPTMLAQFGVLGAAYDRILHGRARPRVGLLSNGTELTKGTELTREAHALLEAAASHPDAAFDYVGYVEGSSLFHGVCDVVATDGFTGNVVLKVSEGVSEAVFRMVKQQLMASVRGRLAGVLARPAMVALKRTIDASETGGALLLGVRGVVVICHGRSDEVAIRNAIVASDRFVAGGLTERLGDALARHARLWESVPAA
ncbi:MAG: phosphate acyltransferase PlsX [Deltaproteobacteria bacterium]|nr:MAG: phosphate acyltransferase PlsX [Deltaproteobacteria bacterium]